MTEKKESVQILANYVKTSGVMVFLEEPEKGEYSLPADLKILKIIKDGDKIKPGQEYTWLIVEDAKGQRSILNAKPADQEEGFKPASQIPRESSKDILQKNLDEKKKEIKKPTPVKAQSTAGVPDLPEECRTCVYVHDCEKLAPYEGKVGFMLSCKGEMEAAIHKAKDDAEGDARLKENAEYAKKLIDEVNAAKAKKEAAAERKATIQKPPVEAPAAVVTVHPVVQAEIVPQNAAVTVREASGTIAKHYTDEDLMLIRNIAAKNCTEPEFKLLMYMAKTYGLDPLLKEIWCVKRNENAPALIFAGRDGFLRIAHESGQFDGLQSGVVYEPKTVDAGKPTERQINVPVSAWCKVWRKDMSHEFISDVPFSEYNTGFSVWKTNPSAMILKVAEAVCLRKAFTIAGIYSPEEIDTEHR